jgi:predicted transglutaminase-like protease
MENLKDEYMHKKYTEPMKNFTYKQCFEDLQKHPFCLGTTKDLLARFDMKNK